MTDTKTRLMVPRILWFAFLISHATFVFVGWFIRSQGDIPPAGDELELFTLILTGIGVVNAVASAVAVPMFMTKADFFTTLILRFAFAESTTIFGVVLTFMGADLMWLYILAAVGATAHIAAYPSEREFEAFERKREQG